MLNKDKLLIGKIYEKLFYYWHFGRHALKAYFDLRTISKLSKLGNEISPYGRMVFYRAKSTKLLYNYLNTDNERVRKRLEKKQGSALGEAVELGGLECIL